MKETLDLVRVTKLISKLGGTMKYFPGDDDARLGIIEQVGGMCSTEDQVEWLVNRMPKLYADWPGMGEMRAVLCSKYKPKDGCESYSSTFPNGIPSEKPEKQWALPPASTLALGPGEPISAAPSLNGYVQQLAEMKRMDNVNPIKPPDLPAARLTPENTITEADIKRAVDELRRKKAEEEAGLKPELVGAEKKS